MKILATSRPLRLGVKKEKRKRLILSAKMLIGEDNVPEDGMFNNIRDNFINI